MSADLPPEIAVVETAEATRYVLPRPAFGLGRLMGGVLTAFGMVPIAMGAWFAYSMFANLGPAGRLWAVGGIVMLVVPLVCCLFGGLLSLLGVWLLFGHGEIAVTADTLSSAFRLGPLAWRGRRQRRQLRRLVVERSTGQPAAGEIASRFAESDQGRPLLLAFVYPADWLAPLAADLAGRCGTGADPLPVLQRVSSRASSRSWRRDRPADGKRPVPSCFLFVWGFIFFAGGAISLVPIFQALVRGDPGGNLQGDYPWKCLWILFPCPFLIPGALVLLHTVRRRAKAQLSPEQKSAEAAAPAPRQEAGAVALATAAPEAEYPTIPAGNSAPGGDLAVRLTANLPSGAGLLIILILVLLCSGVLTPVAAYFVNSLRARQFDWAVACGIVTFILGFLWVMLAAALVQGWRLWRLGDPVVEVSASPLYCGETYDLQVSVPGPARFRWLRVAVVCEERVSYTEGTTTRNEKRRVHDQELARHEDLTVEAAEPLRVRGSFRVPPAAMHSFRAEHNEVWWAVLVEGEARRWTALAFAHDYLLPVRPARDYGVKR
jgi:hypothetical protein